MTFRIRPLSPEDSMEDLTALIHRAYRQLADMGFRYVGTHQTVDRTRERCLGGECYVVVEDEERILGTIVLTHPDKPSDHPWYNRRGVSTFHQFAVEPAFQKRGIGSQLLEFVERRAIDLGAAELACDTAEGASHLIEIYRRRGYRQVGSADWNSTNYRSVILSKSLAPSAQD